MFTIQCNLHQQRDGCETDLLEVKHWQTSQRYTGLNWADKYHRLHSLALQHCCIHHPERRLTTSSGVPLACLILEIYLLAKVQLEQREISPPQSASLTCSWTSIWLQLPFCFFVIELKWHNTGYIIKDTRWDSVISNDQSSV